MAVLREENGGREHPLQGQRIVIGRDPACEIRLSTGQASRRHALIVNEDGVYYIDDLNSVTGTHVNGRRIHERTRLQLMLQSTVEGLSVAAISYYVIGLFGYLVKGAHDAGAVIIDPTLATAVFVPIAVALVWWIVRQIRRRHITGVK